MSSWNAPDIIKVYEEGSQVPGIADNFEWKPLVTNLQPLFEKNSGTVDTTTEAPNGQDASRAGDGETVVDATESSEASTAE